MRLRRCGQPHRALPLHQSAQLIFAETGNRRGEALAGRGHSSTNSATHNARQGCSLINGALAKRQLGLERRPVSCFVLPRPSSRRAASRTGWSKSISGTQKTTLCSDAGWTMPPQLSSVAG